MAMVLISIIPESWFEPLNRLTVRWVTELLRAGGQTPVARQTFIGLDGFRVKVIAECAAVHLAALLAAFIFAFPSTYREKWIGTGTGIVFLFSVNILRIALVTLIGRYFPDRFEIAHVYLGQLGMLLVTIAICLVWCRWVNNTERMHGPFTFIVRFLIFSSVPFLLWIPLNRIYVGLIDRLIAWLFGLVSLRLMIPLSHTMYYQTFSLVALFALLMAVEGREPVDRLRRIAGGIAALTVLQIVFRICNVWISAFDVHWITPISQIVYNCCVYLLPVAIAVRFMIRTEAVR